MVLVTEKSPVIVGGETKYVEELRCDSIDELTPAPDDLAVGSIAWDVTAGKLYGLASTGWVEQGGA